MASSHSQMEAVPLRNQNETDPAPIIKEILDELDKEDLKTFHFQLSNYKESKFKPIPKGRLKDRDTIDTANLLSNHYSRDALQVTQNILLKINQRALASKVEAHIGAMQRDRRWAQDEDEMEKKKKTEKKEKKE